MNNTENINWREIVATFSSYEGTLGNFCNANHITKSQFYYYKLLKKTEKIRIQKDSCGYIAPEALKIL